MVFVFVGRLVLCLLLSLLLALLSLLRAWCRVLHLRLWWEVRTVRLRVVFFSVALVPEDSVSVFSDSLAFPDDNDPDLKSRSESQGTFRQVVNVISSFLFFFSPESCLHNLKPADPASWFCGFGDDIQRDPKVFLFCFNWIRSIMAKVEDRVLTLARGRKKGVSVLPSWGDFYCLSDLLDLHRLLLSMSNFPIF